MALTEWQLSGVEFTNCNCNWGCPCQFNGLPSHGNCCALIFVQIESGRYGKVPLDGLRFGALWSWPQAVHMGNGTRQAILDERADAAQRAALEAICEGRDTDPGTLIWPIFATTVTTSLPTLVRPIDLKIDVDARSAMLRVPGVAEGSGEPDGDEVFTVHLDPDHPEHSYVQFRDRREPLD